MTPKPLRPKPRPRVASIAERLDQLHRVLHSLVTYLKRLDRRTGVIVMALPELKAALAKIDVATNNIAADLKALKGTIQPGMSDADVAEVQGLLDAAVGKLEGIAAETPDA